jgi:hypothetical protein
VHLVLFCSLVSVGHAKSMCWHVTARAIEVPERGSLGENIFFNGSERGKGPINFLHYVLSFVPFKILI